jgi:tetrahydromethanopterin S-methyltransferase subunit B
VDWQKKIVFASFLLGSALVASPAFAQQTDNLQPATLRASDPAPAAASQRKVKKVWTEDSIVEVRSAADKYNDEQEAAKNKAKSSSKVVTVDSPAASVPKGIGAPPLVLHIPSTPEDTQKEIDKRKYLADDFHRLLTDAQERMQAEPDPMVRKTLEEKANLLKFDINSTNSDLKKLEKALDDYQHGKTPEQPKLEAEPKSAGFGAGDGTANPAAPQ